MENAKKSRSESIKNKLLNIRFFPVIRSNKESFATTGGNIRFNVIKRKISELNINEFHDIRVKGLILNLKKYVSILAGEITPQLTDLEAQMLAGEYIVTKKNKDNIGITNKNFNNRIAVLDILFDYIENIKETNDPVAIERQTNKLMIKCQNIEEILQEGWLDYSHLRASAKNFSAKFFIDTFQKNEQSEEKSLLLESASVNNSDDNSDEEYFSTEDPKENISSNISGEQIKNTSSNEVVYYHGLPKAQEFQLKKFTDKLRSYLNEAFIECILIFEGRVSAKPDSIDKITTFIDKVNLPFSHMFGCGSSVGIFLLNEAVKYMKGLTAKDIVKNTAGVFSNISKADQFIEINSISLIFAQEMARKYSDHIAIMSDDAIKTFAKFIACRVLQYVGSAEGQYASSVGYLFKNLTRTVFCTIRNQFREWISGSFYLGNQHNYTEPLTQLFMGVYYGISCTDEKNETKLQKNKDYEGYGGVWTVEGVLLRSGVSVKNQDTDKYEYFVKNSYIDTKSCPDIYGYRLATEFERKILNYNHKQHEPLPLNIINTKEASNQWMTQLRPSN